LRALSLRSWGVIREALTVPPLLPPFLPILVKKARNSAESFCLPMAP